METRPNVLTPPHFSILLSAFISLLSAFRFRPLPSALALRKSSDCSSDDSPAVEKSSDEDFPCRAAPAKYAQRADLDFGKSSIVVRIQVRHVSKFLQAFRG